MAEFRLERFKYTWKGEWSSGVSYKRDDVVRVNGKSYVCVVTHTSSNIFRTDLNAILPGSNPPQPQPKWVVMTSGKAFLGDYQTGINYNLGDIVRADGVLWVCTESHTSTGDPAEASNFEVFANTISFEGNWQTGTYYGPGAIVKYNSMNYRCLTAHTSGSTLEDNISDWEVYIEGSEYLGAWQPNTEYRLNDLVKYGSTVFKCTETHTSNSTNIDESRFEIAFLGTQYDSDWDAFTYYNVGDIVRHKGFMYYALNNNFNSTPYIDSDEGTDDWLLLSRSFYFAGDWDVNQEYKTGEIVLRGGNLYLALRDIGGNSQDGSTADYLDNTIWELLIPGKAWKGTWSIGVYYSEGDVVYHRGTSYTCNFEHLADAANFPGDNGNIYNYWDILIETNTTPQGLEVKGDLLTYGLSRDLDSIADTSTLGNTRVPIGEEDQILSISQDLEAFWRNITVDADVVYVSTNGIDDFDRGTFERPFKTIRYACEYVEDNFDPLTPVIVRVSAGRFLEIGPIIVPAGCAINGSELRSTVLEATGPKEEYQDDYDYLKEMLDRFENIILDIVTAQPVNPTTGNNKVQITEENYVSTPRFINFPISTVEATGVVANLKQDYFNYIEFRTLSGDVDPTIIGSNNPTSIRDNELAAEALYINREFILEELYAHLVETYPDVTFDYEKVKVDGWSLLRGLIRDLRYSGNYGTLIAADRYASAVLGSKLSDLCRVRDTTGLRDLTVRGLQGTLQPPQVFELYQRPTGGACVALDPGWGPDDERTWIVNRSPYIQGVTNIGTGCVGKKIDGSLHNGGNRSMVSNDFTQVLSDGVGVWVSDNARTELVSVFTYYCQVGYFAENGGIIRATNGNNSYGTYGAIADGADETETPQNVSVMNQNNEAQVTSAIAGGNDDRIFVFEYGNCGEEYTQADATIIGAGANADIEYSDFRDGAIFEARLTLDPAQSGGEGGSGYLIRQGSAQETLGASSTIKLSANDVTQDVSEILGMRLIITDGTGVGQYGIVNSFNFVNKEVGILKESDGLAGWDHIIPGYPIEADLDLTTRYRIEPRITTTSPGFSSIKNETLFANRTYVGFEYNNTKEVFTGISGDSDVPFVDDNGDNVTIDSIVSGVALQLSGVFAEDFDVPFIIEGETSGARATITALTANVNGTLEVDINGGGNSFELGENLIKVLVAGTGNTFDDDPVAAVFDVTRVGKTYTVTLDNPGAGYSVGDTITIFGTTVGGATPENDITITITDVSDDSSSSIQSFTYSGTSLSKRFVALTNAEYVQYSDTGDNFTEISLPFISTYTALESSEEGLFVAIASDENRIAVSETGEDWSIRNLPQTAQWSDIVYGGGKWAMVATDLNEVLVSSDAQTWTSYPVPDDIGGDASTFSQWAYITYGKGIYLAVSANDYATATSVDGGVTWIRHDEVLPDLSPDDPWSVVSVTYGDNRFIILDSTGRTAYSFDGATWYQGGDTPASSNWANVVYGNGVFVALTTDLNNVIATSEDGLIWTSRNTSASQRWSQAVFSTVDGVATWVAIANAAQTNAIEHFRTGKQLKLRSDVLQGSFQSIKIWDPGSGYSESNLPTIEVIDPNATTDIVPEARLGNGVLAQPDFINRGAGYRTTTSTITITGDGYADIIPTENTLILAGVTDLPGPGVQIRIDGVLNLDTEDDLTDLKVFTGVEVIDLGDDGSGNGTRLVQFTVNPSLGVQNNVTHGLDTTLRERYSQCRITGHDFLDIGTGNFENTNYPDIYASGNYFVALPENEVFEANGGKIFYTSTDQDGNFRTGELFAVQQSTGIVTISAQFFDLDGLSELALGGVRLGGSGTVVNEFSTDGAFIADSNSVIPTQRAIATFLANRLSVGGENLEVNRLVAGRIGVGGVDNSIENVTREYTVVPVDVRIAGTYTDEDEVIRPVGLQGTIISQMLILKTFDESMQ